MKFLNLETGYSFDGLWSNQQSKGYIFWFPKEQSVNITYTMPIAIITDNGNALNLHIEQNDIFSFISLSENVVTIDGYEFDGEPMYSTEITTTPEQVDDKYIHVFNVACNSANAGEYICRINIDDDSFIRVGADFYGENEMLHINLSNMGVELPTTIQKAIYDTNVHEDVTDNIIINRKLKELLSNYWDIIANKGSYKSLLNAIEWFEWDDTLTLKEIYKHVEANRFMFNDAFISPTFVDNINDSFGNFIKTSYISLYCSLQNETSQYDIEHNPELEAAVLKWSRNDIQLKIALLAQFFGIYFMPIHTQLLHAVAEDKVFANTIKTICGAQSKREDTINDYGYVECNIKDNTIFRMSNVKTQTTNDTVYGITFNHPDYVEGKFFGVDLFPSDITVTDDETHIKELLTHYYTGPGVVIPFEMTITNQMTHDFLKLTVVEYTNENGEQQSIHLYDKIDVVDNKIHINFNFLAKTAQNYLLKFTFILGSSRTLNKTVKFIVEDADNLNINVYKIKSKNDRNRFTIDDFTDTQCSKYLFKIQKRELDKPYYTQYLPYMSTNNPLYRSYNGIKLNRTIVVDLLNKNNLREAPHTPDEIQYLRELMSSGFIEFAKYGTNDNDNNPIMTYLIFVSNSFYAPVPPALYNNDYGYKFNIIRNDLGFYPQFHYLEKMTGNNIDNYTVSQYDAICCAAEINDGNVVKEFRYGHMIDNAEWTFYNNLTDEYVDFMNSSQKPFIANSSNNSMQPGYYDITFRYSLTNGVTCECKLDSAFRIK